MVKKMSERRRRVVELMTLGGLTASDAARAVGVKPGTVRQWFCNEPEYRGELEAWRAGPPLDEVMVAQTRRLIIDELARRVLHGRSTMSLRDLLTIHDRLTQETTQNTEEKDDEETESGARGIKLTPEQAERIWAEIERGVGGAPENASEHETQP
jgi:transposase-like protein